MIKEIEHMIRSFKQCDNISDIDDKQCDNISGIEDIISWFEILYVLQINKNNAAQSVDQIEAIIRSIASAECIEDHNYCDEKLIWSFKTP